MDHWRGRDPDYFSEINWQPLGLNREKFKGEVLNIKYKGLTTLPRTSSSRCWGDLLAVLTLYVEPTNCNKRSLRWVLSTSWLHSSTTKQSLDFSTLKTSSSRQRVSNSWFSTPRANPILQASRLEHIHPQPWVVGCTVSLHSFCECLLQEKDSQERFEKGQ